MDCITKNSYLFLKDRNLPSLKGDLERIHSVIRGNDNLIRVVDVRTQNGIKRRAISEISPFPLVHDETFETMKT